MQCLCVVIAISISIDVFASNYIQFTQGKFIAMLFYNYYEYCYMYQSQKFVHPITIYLP